MFRGKGQGFGGFGGTWVTDTRIVQGLNVNTVNSIRLN